MPTKSNREVDTHKIVEKLTDTGPINPLESVLKLISDEKKSSNGGQSQERGKAQTSQAPVTCFDLQSISRTSLKLLETKQEIHQKYGLKSQKSVNAYSSEFAPGM